MAKTKQVIVVTTPLVKEIVDNTKKVIKANTHVGFKGKAS